MDAYPLKAAKECGLEARRSKVPTDLVVGIICLHKLEDIAQLNISALNPSDFSNFQNPALTVESAFHMNNQIEGSTTPTV